MAYEIDFIGVGKDECTTDADAICLRWKCGVNIFGTPLYKVGVIDGGFEVHGEKMVNHINQFYFNDVDGKKSPADKVIDFMVITHPDQDHTIGLKIVLESFDVKGIYMNRPWLYIDELWDKVSDGRITKDSLKSKLRETYSAIADIENIAIEKGITIYEAFQGTCIENNLLILSPSKQFYLDLLVESQKTPFQEKEGRHQNGLLSKLGNALTENALNLFENWDIETLREGEKTSAENETSVILRGLIDADGFLLTGDAGIRALNKAMDYMDLIGEDIQKYISFYQIPHHGSRHNVSPSILNRMIGNKVAKGYNTGKSAIASAAEDSDHPRKMVTNAYIRRGVTPYSNSGNIICHHVGVMPNRGWQKSKNIDFSRYVEEWDK